MKGTGLQWDMIAQPDIFSCLDDGEDIRTIGWILRRKDNGDCVFYGDCQCGIYEWRPMICRCYPFFTDGSDVEVMHCEGGKNRIDKMSADLFALMVKRYEIKKLRSYTGIILQLGTKLKLHDLRPLPPYYEGKVTVYDGESVTLRRIRR